MKINLWNGRTLVIEIKPSIEDIILLRLNMRYKSSVDGLWWLDRISAIKEHRALRNSGLMEAKKYVDDLIAKKNLRLFLSESEYDGLMEQI